MRELARVYELAASLKGAQRSYFRNFAASLRDNPLKLKHFTDIEAELALLDDAAWNHLKANVGPLFMRNERPRDWRGACSVLNEAKAYNFLIRRGYTSVEFVPRHVEGKTPDLRARQGSIDVLCEAKTINRSERSASPRLRPEFFVKLASTARRADRQMATFASPPDTKRIVYIVVDFDASLAEHIDRYLAQIQERRAEFLLPGIEVVLDVDRRLVGLTT